DPAQPGGAAGFGGTFRRTFSPFCAPGSRAMIRKLLLSGAIAIVFAGCASTPPPVLQPGDVPAAFEQRASANAPLWPARDWWTNYGDPQLAVLMDQARANNLDIAQAAARLRQADARARQAGAALLPTVGAGGTVNSLYGQANG